MTLPDPTTLPNLSTSIIVKVWKAAGYLLHIAPGVGLTIDNIADGIRTRTPNQSFVFRWGPSSDEFIGTTGADGWVTTKTVHGGGEGGTATGAPPEGTPGVVACSDAVPNWISDVTLAVDYQVLTDADGTYNKPDIPGARFVGVVGWGSGAGGGSGDYGEASGGAGGGSGGGGGARKVVIYDYATFPAAVTYHVAQGGPGGQQSINYPVDPGVPPEDGTDGEASTLTESIAGDIFFVGGGSKGLLGGGGASVDVGGGGGSWDQNGTGSVTNANATGGIGGGGVAAAEDDPANYGCAECGGGGGGGGNGPIPHGVGRGAGSLHGGGGGGAGGVWAFPTGIEDGSEGGNSTYANGGGGAAGTNADPTANPGGNGAAGTGLDGGSGGGGGGMAQGAGDLTGGNGGHGGIPGGGGGGGGPAANNGVHIKKGGAGGNGARGEIRMYVV